MTKPMLADLDEVVRLMGRATPGLLQPEFGEAYNVRAAHGGIFAQIHNLKGRHGMGGRVDGNEAANNARLIAASVNFLRTHAPALADMAKRLEAAERECEEQARLNGMGAERELALRAKLEVAERKLEIRRYELAHAWAVRDRLVQHMTSIHALLYPEPVEANGKTLVFRPKNIDPHEVMQELSDRIRAIPAAIDATQEGEG